MNLKDDVKPITYLKNHTADLVREVHENGRTVVITQNGEAKVVLMDVESFDRGRRAMALLRVLALAQSDIEAGRTVTQDEAFARAERTIGQKFKA